jgi:hypothetical protein
MHVADIERELKAAIEAFDGSETLRTCRACGHVQPARARAADAALNGRRTKLSRRG